MKAAVPFRLRRFGALLLLIFLLCGLLGSAESSVYADDGERKKLRVGFFAFDGYHMIDEDGERSGYGYDFLRLTSRYLNVDYEYLYYDRDWDDMLELLKSGEIDMVTSAQMTTERLESFAFSKPIGKSSAMLTVSQSNRNVVAGEYSTYDGMKIGLLVGNSRNEDLESHAAMNGFSYTPVYFERFTELEAALNDGSIDAALTSSLRETTSERVIELFATQDFYVVVRKEDTELLELLNYAIDQLNAVEGDWRNDLDNKYYDHLEERDLSFTERELEIIAQYASGEKTLLMSASHDRAPYSYSEGGKLKGIIPDYFAELAAYVGIPYELYVPSSREEYEQIRMDCVIDGSIDARIDSTRWAEENSYSFSAPYTTMRLAIVTRRDFDGEIDRLAVASAQGLFGLEDGIAPNAERIDVASREDGMQAVLDGRADAVVVYLYTAQQFVNQDERGLLTYTLLSEPTYEYRVAFTPNVSHELSGIFTKAIYAMPDGLFEKIASQYTSYKAEDVDLLTWIQIHPLPTIAICLAAIVMCLLLVLLYERQRTIKLEQKRSSELSALAERAERASRAKSDFLANVSHDIRTPMNAIVGFANLMEGESGLSENLHGYIKKIQYSSRHLLSLVDDVLDMSRIEANHLAMFPENLSLTEEVEQIEAIIRDATILHGQSFEVKLGRITHDRVVADGSRIRQVLLNLLQNSVKYTQNGGSVELSVDELSCYIASDGVERAKFRFVVSDNGSGIAPELMAHLFEPFARGEASVTNKIQGTGLGMAITKSIVDCLNGEISVDSTEGKGSRFTVILSFDVVSESEKESAEENVALEGMRFLCAEDNMLNAEILEGILELQGASCRICTDGSELVSLFESIEPGEYDAVLMDIQMPNMNGLEAARALRSSKNPLGRTIPIIAMTANAFSEDVRSSLEAGMNAHISKPINMEVLIKTVNELCRKDTPSDW